MFNKLTIFSPLILVTLVACGGGGGGGGGATNNDSGSSSSGGSDNTHFAGSNCIECHEDFTISGTVYTSSNTPQTDAVITVYVADTNQVVTTLNTDASGNFSTTETIQELHPDDALNGFAIGINVSVTGPRSGEDIMGPSNSPSVLTGDANCTNCQVSCNSCHGVSRGSLRAN